MTLREQQHERAFAIVSEQNERYGRMKAALDKTPQMRAIAAVHRRFAPERYQTWTELAKMGREK
jgi:hypothetical protein